MPPSSASPPIRCGLANKWPFLACVVAVRARDRVKPAGERKGYHPPGEAVVCRGRLHARFRQDGLARTRAGCASGTVRSGGGPHGDHRPPEILYDHQQFRCTAPGDASVVQGKTSANRREMQVQGLPGAPRRVPRLQRDGEPFLVSAWPAALVTGTRSRTAAGAGSRLPVRIRRSCGGRAWPWPRRSGARRVLPDTFRRAPRGLWERCRGRAGRVRPVRIRGSRRPPPPGSERPPHPGDLPLPPPRLRRPGPARRRGSGGGALRSGPSGVRGGADMPRARMRPGAAAPEPVASPEAGCRAMAGGASSWTNRHRTGVHPVPGATGRGTRATCTPPPPGPIGPATGTGAAGRRLRHRSGARRAQAATSRAKKSTMPR